MKKQSTSRTAFLTLRVLIALVVALAGIGVTLFATANSSVVSGRGSARGPRTPIAPAGSSGPVVVGTTLIRGPDRAYQPGASFADLDHGFAAGATRYLHDDGLITTTPGSPFYGRKTAQQHCFSRPMIAIQRAVFTSRTRSHRMGTSWLAALHSWMREHPGHGSVSSMPDLNTFSYHLTQEVAAQSPSRTMDS